MLTDNLEYDYTVYEKESGAWVKNLMMLPDSAILNFNKETEVLIEGSYGEDTYYLRGKIHNCGEKPHRWAKWSNKIKGWVDKRNEEELIICKNREIANNKALRNKLLANCDWTMGEDSPLDPETKEKWRIYRQELRDITVTCPDLSDVKWPIPPKG